MKQKIKKSVIIGSALAGLFVLGAYGVLKGPEWHGEYIRNKVGSQVVMLTNKEGNHGGTGFALQMPSGEVLTLTNAHVCGLEEDGQIYARSGRKKLPMTVFEKSDKADLCLLNGIPNMDGLKLANSVRIGQELAVVGHPALMPLALSRGNLLGYEKIIVLVSMEPCEKEGGMYKNEMTMIGPVCTEQFDAGLTTIVVLGGNSGSPVVDFFGNVTGVLFASPGPEGANWGIIVPLAAVKDFIKEY